MFALVRALFELGASTLAPNRCAACDGDVAWMTVFCPECATTLRVPDEQDPSQLAAFVYGGAVARAIIRLKFERRPDLARPLSAALRRSARSIAGDPPDLVIPVPLHPRRLVERGYNQSALLAAPVARDLRVRLLTTGLERVRDTEHQASLDRAARAKNIVGAFRVRRPGSVDGYRIVVVDDVRTTGATLAACADALLAAGARDVRSLVLAATEDHGP